jgi:predicted AlkP superfamily phosphohydrolase/phosphomutase
MQERAGRPAWPAALPVTVAHVVAAAMLGLAVAADLTLSILAANHVPLLSRTAGGIAALALAALGGPVFAGYLALVAALSAWGPVRRRLPDAHTPIVALVLALLLLGAAAAAVQSGAEAALAFAGRHVVLIVLLIASSLASLSARLSGPGVVLAGAIPTGIALPLVVLGLGVPLRWVDSEQGVEPRDPLHRGRLVLVGVDGLCWETLGRWRAAGGSPDLEWFERNGLVGRLDTIVPTQSPTVWSTIATGRHPSDHGVLSFTAWDLAMAKASVSRLPRYTGAFAWLPMAESMGLTKMRQVSSVDLRAPPLWEIFADPERGCTVAGWWCSWPAAPINGRMITDKFYFWRETRRAGSDAQARTGVTYPEPLNEKIDGFRVSPQQMAVEDVQRFADVSDAQAHRMLAAKDYQHHSIESELPLAYTMDETYFELAEYLLDTGPAQGFYAFYARGVDLVGHAAMHASDLYPEAEATAEERRRYGRLTSSYYEYTFARLRQLIEKIGPEATVIIVSDHGFERVAPGEFGHENAPPGVIMIPQVEEGASLGQPTPSVYDIAPTLLWLAGYPAAEDMPGRVLVEAFPRHARFRPPRARVPTYGTRWNRAPVDLAADDASNEEQLELLRSLGYIQ